MCVQSKSKGETEPTDIAEAEAMAPIFDIGLLAAMGYPVYFYSVESTPLPDPVKARTTWTACYW